MTSGPRAQPDDFAALRQAGFDVVINLALPTSVNALPNEGELVSAQGMTYVHIPVKFDAPQPADFERFTRLMDACADQRVFVHCAREHACLGVRLPTSPPSWGGPNLGGK